MSRVASLLKSKYFFVSLIFYKRYCKPKEKNLSRTADSHKMVIVLSENGFDGVKSPFLIQQYYDHDEEFYKCYVIGEEDVMVSKQFVTIYTFKQF